MKRSGPLRRYTELRRTTALERESKRHAREQRQLDAAKAIVLERSQGRCEACDHHILPECPGIGQDVHHVLSRGRGGKHDPSNLLHVSRIHHGWIGDHPREAEQLDLLDRSTGNGRVTIWPQKDTAA